MILTVLAPFLACRLDVRSLAIVPEVANVSGWAGPEAIDRIVVVITVLVVAVTVLRTIVGLGLALLARRPGAGEATAKRLGRWSRHVTPRIVLRLVAGLVSVLPALLLPAANASPVPQSGPTTTAPSGRAPIGSPATYLVRRGDSLWSIAAAQLPRHCTDVDIDRAWRRLYAANTSAIGPDPNHIAIGHVLVMPPAGAPRQPATARANTARANTTPANTTRASTARADALVHRFDPDRPATTTGAHDDNHRH